MNSKFDGPFVSAFETDSEGVIKQELVTYRVKDGMLRKETTSRKFNADQTDWHDSQSVDPIMEIK
ncbi:hypothetical protein OAP94_01355 [bacterium]|jgi:hypothetical protein|nr:hypothetical protein [bacterium]MDC1007308.1 hypothetical protein [bacterium]